MSRILIAGGGFFGMYLAESLAKVGHSVRIVEKEEDFMQRASYVNQARVHNGYHYPRSILTALRSKESFPNFVREFEECIDNEFEKYYMIPKRLSKVSAGQFSEFCSRIGVPCEEASGVIKKLANPNFIDTVLKTKEYAFNSPLLKETMVKRMDYAGVEQTLNSAVESIQQVKGGVLAKVIHSQGEVTEFECDHVFNCTYSMINKINSDSGIKLIPLKHELAEMVLVNVPDELKGVGLTVMDGPFFSIMPFPSENLHSFSHVRYTPHCSWQEGFGTEYASAHELFRTLSKQSNFNMMRQDAQRYMPVLKDLEFEKSLWEVKTLLPKSEADDSRPILFKSNYTMKGYHCVMGGKIDNVFDAMAIVERDLVVG